MAGSQAISLAALRQKLARVGQTPVGERSLTRQPVGRRVATDWPPIDALLQGGLEAHAVHEWIRAPAHSPHPAAMPPFAILTHLARQALRQASPIAQAVWVGCRPDPAALALGAENLLDRSLFIAISRRDQRLAALDLAIRCDSIEVIIADGQGFQLLDTQRLNLQARAHGVMQLLARPSRDRHELSAAQTRWQVATEPGETDAAIAQPRWRIELLRSRGVISTEERPNWALELDRETGVVGLHTGLGAALRETTPKPAAAAS